MRRPSISSRALRPAVVRCNITKVAFEIGVGHGVERRVPDFGRFQHPQTVVNEAVNMNYFGMADEEVNGRQEALPLQSAAIEILRGDVGGGHERDAVGQQRLDKAPQQHGIGNVGDEELVETDHTGLTGEIRGDDSERILYVAKLRKPAVHPAHDPVKVVAPLVVEGQPVEKQVHHQRLATTHATPQVDATDGCDHRHNRQEALEKAWHPPPRRPRRQLAGDPVQRLHGANLRGVGV